MSAIQRRTKEISVLVGDQERRFLLRAYSIAEQLEFFEKQEEGLNAALDQAVDAIGSTIQRSRGSRAYLEFVRPVVVRQLDTPIDGGGPLGAEEFWQLDTYDPARVMAAQESLTNMAGIVGNGLGLLVMAGRQILEKLQDPGSKLEPPSPEQA